MLLCFAKQNGCYAQKRVKAHTTEAFVFTFPVCEGVALFDLYAWARTPSCKPNKLIIIGK
jgi:hypothetical protein